MMHEQAIAHTRSALAEPPPDFSGGWVNQLLDDAVYGCRRSCDRRQRKRCEWRWRTDQR